MRMYYKDSHIKTITSIFPEYEWNIRKFRGEYSRNIANQRVKFYSQLQFKDSVETDCNYRRIQVIYLEIVRRSWRKVENQIDGRLVPSIRK